MEEPPVSKEDGQDRALHALQVAAVSGFTEDNKNIETSCLLLCNACRNGVPVPNLKIRGNVPSSLLAELHPGTSRLESQATSRVLPHRRVLKVEWRVPRGGRSTLDFDPFRHDEQRREERHHVFNINMTEVKWPEGTVEIALLRFYGSIEGIAWPASLVRLAFCILDDADYCFYLERFNQPLDGVTFPAGLRELFLGVSFNQPIDNVIFPEGLEKLSMPGFNQSMQNVHWPVRLKTLELLDPLNIYLREERPATPYGPRNFNQPLDATLPSTLETLWLSDDFNQPVDGVVWPTNLVEVNFGCKFRCQSLSGTVWPSTLRVLLVCHDFPDGYGELPEDCKVINRSNDHHWSDIEDDEDEEEEEYMIEVDEFEDEYDRDY